MMTYDADWVDASGAIARGVATFTATGVWDEPTDTLTLSVAADAGTPELGDVLYFVMPDVGFGSDAMVVRLPNDATAIARCLDRDEAPVAAQCN